MNLIERIKKEIENYKKARADEKIILKKLGIRGRPLETGIYNTSELDEMDITPEIYRNIVETYLQEISSNIARKNRRDFLPKIGNLFVRDGTVGITDEEIEEKILSDFTMLQNSKKIDWDNMKTVCYLIFNEVKRLINIYGTKALINNTKQIKLEIKGGIDTEREASKYGKELDEEYIDQIVYLGEHFSEGKISQYKNLDLLCKRYEGVLENSSSDEERDDIKKTIEEITKMLATDVKELDLAEVGDKMDEWYLEYEMCNRSTLVDKLFSPKQDMTISDEGDLGNMLVHFFDEGRDVSRFKDVYRKNIEERILNRTGKSSIESLSEEEKQEIEIAMRDFTEVKGDIIKVNNTANIELIARNGIEYATKSNVSNQISASVVGKSILNSYEISIGVGFDASGVPLQNIATVSDHNIYSNQGLYNIPSKNEFEEFSSSVSEMLNENNVHKNEVVMFRNTEEGTLTPAYFLCVCNEDCSEKEYKEIIDKYRAFAKGKGLKFVFVDAYTINKAREDKYRQELIGNDMQR